MKATGTLKDGALKKYSENVNKNKDYLKKLIDIKSEFNQNEYKDPDVIIETATVEGIQIEIATDGLCGIKKIIQFGENNDDIISKYEKIRSVYLKWPAYAMSINQQRGYKNTFDDRIDLLLLDLEKFFKIIEKEHRSYYKTIQEIQENCKLFRAYLNTFTFMWLKSFGTFSRFITVNHYETYVLKTEEVYKAVKWTNTEIFDGDYFSALLDHVNFKNVL